MITRKRMTDSSVPISIYHRQRSPHPISHCQTHKKNSNHRPHIRSSRRPWNWSLRHRHRIRPTNSPANTSSHHFPLTIEHMNWFIISILYRMWRMPRMLSQVNHVLSIRSDLQMSHWPPCEGNWCKHLFGGCVASTEAERVSEIECDNKVIMANFVKWLFVAFWLSAGLWFFLHD